MTRPGLFLAGALLAALSAVLSGAGARACGITPEACGGDAAADARYMLQRVVAAVLADKAKALQQFSRGEGGFRTVDSYVFCVGPDGTMTAHPNPTLRGQDVHDLHDETGNHFIATMLKTAEAGKVQEIHYLFPRLGSTAATGKTTWYTRAGDQVCGVGVYDGDAVAATDGTPAKRIAALRQRLTAAMPAALAADWSALQQALDEQAAAQAAAISRAKEQLDSVASAGGPTEPQ